MSFIQSRGESERSDLSVPSSQEVVFDYENLIGRHYDPNGDPEAMDRLALDVMADLVRYRRPDVNPDRQPG